VGRAPDQVADRSPPPGGSRRTSAARSFGLRTHIVIRDTRPRLARADELIKYVDDE